MVDDKKSGASMTMTASVQLPPADTPRLLVFTDAGRKVYPLPAAGPVVLGRGSDVDVLVDDPSLSRRHARITLGAALVLEDLGSRNGTHVEGRALRVGESAEIAAGDAFGLGKTVCVIELPARKATKSGAPGAPGAAKKPPASARQKLESLVALVAASDISAVLHGETGVGKEVTARAIHEASSRKSGPFVGINCAALPENLLESELFGYERGAFTGAQQAKPGLFEAAQAGTIFLDEIADMTPAVQAKLLRVLEERQVQRLGAVKPRAIDVRFLSASHKPLDGEVAAGRFRQDLFFRLAGITLTLPPLRERSDEIPVLAQRFLDEAAARAKRPAPVLSDAARAALQAHPWPGNIRELKNTVERGLLLSAGEGVIDVEHLQLHAAISSPSAPGARAAADEAAPEAPPADNDEKGRIVRALRDAAGNQTKAAELLGVSRRTLVNRIIALGIPRPRKGV